MSTKLLKLPKGTTIQLKGSQYTITRTTNVNVRCLPQQAADTPVQGEHRTDEHPQRIKNAISKIIEKRLQRLEEEELQALFAIEEDDPLFLFDGAEDTPKASFADQVQRTRQITEFKQILKEIKAL